MFVDIEQLKAQNVFDAPDSVECCMVAGLQMIKFHEREINNLREKVGQFFRIRPQGEKVKFSLAVHRNRLGKLDFLWKSNVKPQNWQIVEQKMNDLNS